MSIENPFFSRDLVALKEHPRTWNFFIGQFLLALSTTLILTQKFPIGKALLTTQDFPDDLDTTALALTVIQRDEEVVHSVMDEMQEYTNADGLIQVSNRLSFSDLRAALTPRCLQAYFDHGRPRIDPVVCTNVLSLFCSYGRGHELSETFQWVYEVLLHRAYLGGTRYYTTPECFLFFLSRLIGCSDSPELHQQLKPLLIDRIWERVGVEGDALALAMRVLICKSMGIRNEIDFRSLLPLQCDDGGWEICWMEKSPGPGIRIGNRGLTTALAINAIIAMEEC